MTKQTLEQLYAEHNGKVSDKWSSYLVECGRILGEYRDKPVRLLEIGVQNGGSLEIWSKFFVNAQKLVGCDINPDCAQLEYEDPRITLIVGDANLDTVQYTVLQQSPVFDVIIDDGSHTSSDIVKSFAKYFPHLADGGVFVAEDLHCSYWAEFEGGLFDPFSSITFFKRLADIVNHEHWGVAKTRSTILGGFFLKYEFQIDEDVLAHIHSIEFVNSMCVIRKDTAKNNLLGSRFISGKDDMVVLIETQTQSLTSETPSQINNNWTTRIIAPDEDVIRLEKGITERDEQIALLLASKDMVLNSLSWRLTKPLRFAKHKINKILLLFNV